MADVVLADCGQDSQQFPEAAYFQNYTENAPQDTAIVETLSSTLQTWENSDLWAYFTDTGVNFTANLGKTGVDGEYAGTAYNGYVHFTCWQHASSGYIYLNNDLNCVQRYDCNHSELLQMHSHSDMMLTRVLSSFVIFSRCSAAYFIFVGNVSYDHFLESASYTTK